MSELVSQIAQRTGISEDKARQAAEVAINFFKSKLPGVGGQLDGVLHGGASGTGAVGEKVQEGLGGVFVPGAAPGAVGQFIQKLERDRELVRVDLARPPQAAYGRGALHVKRLARGPQRFPRPSRWNRSTRTSRRWWDG